MGHRRENHTFRRASRGAVRRPDRAQLHTRSRVKLGSFQSGAFCLANSVSEGRRKPRSGTTSTVPMGHRRENHTFRRASSVAVRRLDRAQLHTPSRVKPVDFTSGTFCRASSVSEGHPRADFVGYVFKSNTFRRASGVSGTQSELTRHGLGQFSMYP